MTFGLQNAEIRKNHENPENAANVEILLNLVKFAEINENYMLSLKMSKNKGGTKICESFKLK